MTFVIIFKGDESMIRGKCVIRQITRGLWGLLALAALIWAAAGCGSAGSASGTALGTVNGVEVYEKEFDEWYLQFWGGEEGKNQYLDMFEQYRNNYIQGYMEQVALLQKAEAEGIQASKEAVDAEIDSYKARFADAGGKVDTAQLAEDLKQKGFTEKSLRTYYERNMTLQALYTQVTQDVTVDEAQIQAYYDGNSDLFTVSQKVKTKNIVVDTEDEAREIIRELDGGSDFAELAKTKSSDASAKDNGGDIPEFDVDGPYVQPYKDAAFALNEPGDYTKEPVQSEFGYHVILLEDKTPSRARSLEEVREEIRNNLLAERKQAVFEEYLAQVIDEANIQINLPSPSPSPAS
jgi:parvulin-like peptidyl-prolyl isomerase